MRKTDSQLRCPVCNGLLEPVYNKRGAPKWCLYCGVRLPRPNQPGFDRMMRQGRVLKDG